MTGFARSAGPCRLCLICGLTSGPTVKKQTYALYGLTYVQAALIYLTTLTFLIAPTVLIYLNALTALIVPIYLNALIDLGGALYDQVCVHNLGP